MPSRRLAFLDFEASGLGTDSYPIEVAWGFADLPTIESCLIRRPDHWTDWDPMAEALHGLSRSTLRSEGRLAWDVATAMNEALSHCEVHADSDMDRFWLARLFEEAPFASMFDLTICTPACLRTAIDLSQTIATSAEGRHRGAIDVVALADAHRSSGSL